MKHHIPTWISATILITSAAAEIQSVKIPSERMNRDIPATVTLPAGYHENATPRPVVYLLHGAGDDERAWCDRTPVQQMADAYGVIFVSPSVGTSWYFDSPEDKNSQFETFVSSELVKFVDARYRTIPKREARALAGNSMGGHGAMFLAVRHKEVFGAAAPMSGGMDIRASDPQVGAFPENWGLKQRLGPIEKHPERWNELTVINLVDSLKDGELAISIDCGTEDFFLTVNRRLHGKLTARGILHNYAEHPGGHGWVYWKPALPRQMAFLSRHLEGASGGKPARGDADFAQPSPSARHTEKVAAIKSGDYDLVLIGDSITHTLHNFGGKYDTLNAVWNKHYAPRRAINLGHNGYRTEQILWNLQNGELDFKKSPKVFVILLGTNNADGRNFPRRHTGWEIFNGIHAIVKLIRERHPTSKILLLRPFPKGLDAQRGEATSPPVFSFSRQDLDALHDAGALMARLADGKQVFWLDVNHIFLRPDGTIHVDLMWDLLHPNAAGAEAWAQAIEPTLAQLMGDKPITNPQPASVIPAPRGDGSYDWMARHETALQAKMTNPQIVFIGDSITHHLGGVPAPTGPFISHRGDAFWNTICTADRPGLNLGFGADWTQHALWRIDHGELDGLAPRHVVLMIGTNNILHGTGNTAEIVAGVRACLLRIRAKTPWAKIILMGAPPCRNPSTHPNRILAAQVNQGLKKLAVEAKTPFLDLTPRFIGADGNIPASLMDDAIHPTPAGYQIWSDALAPLIR